MKKSQILILTVYAILLCCKQSEKSNMSDSEGKYDKEKYDGALDIKFIKSNPNSFYNSCQAARVFINEYFLTHSLGEIKEFTECDNTDKGLFKLHFIVRPDNFSRHTADLIYQVEFKESSISLYDNEKLLDTILTEYDTAVMDSPK